jgi:hypothetical protein
VHRADTFQAMVDEHSMLLDGLVAFARAGRPGFRHTRNSAELEALRDFARARLPAGADAGDVDDLLDFVIREAVVRVALAAGGGDHATAAPVFFAYDPDYVGQLVSRRRDRMRAIYLVAEDRHLYRKREWEIAAAVLAQLRWPRADRPLSDGANLEAPASQYEATVGSLRNAWVTVGIGPYRPEHLQLEACDVPRVYEPAVESANDAYTGEIAARAAGHRPTDNTCLGLLEFDVTGRTPEVEDPMLHLRFARTGYFRGQVTNWRLDRPYPIDGEWTTLRRKWAASADLRTAPVEQLANVWGVILSVISADGWLLLLSGWCVTL